MPIRGFLDLRGADKTILRHCRLCAPATIKYKHDNKYIRLPRGGLCCLIPQEIAAPRKPCAISPAPNGAKATQSVSL